MTRPTPRERERGFTLIETIVVVAMLGLVAAVLAATFTVVVRSTPSAEARADDSRSLNGLTNWLSQDVSSTSESGFRAGNFASSCGGVPTSIGLVELRWASFTADYRWVASVNGMGAIHRFTCTGGGTATDLKVTADMRPAPTTSTLALKPAPVDVTLLPTTSGNPGNGGLEFFVYVFEADGSQRELLRLDATSRNVRTTLPPLPPGGAGGGPGNRAPAAGNLTITAEPGATTSFSPLPIDDPDNDPLTVSVSAPVPAASPAWNPAVTFDGGTTSWVLTFDVHGNADPGDTYTMAYQACDNGTPQLCDPGTITVRIVPPANDPPSATPLDIVLLAGDSVVDRLLPIADEDVLAVSAIEFRNAPAGWNPTFSCRRITGVPGCYLSFATAVTDASATFEYRVFDDAGQENVESWQEISVDVTSPPPNAPPVAGAATFTVAAGSTNTVELPVTDENPASLTYDFRSVPTGWNPSGSGNTLTFTTRFSNAGTYDFEYEVTDDIGQRNGGGRQTITVVVTNAPPTAGPVSTNAAKGQQFSVILPASDPEGQPIGVVFTLPSGPPNWSTPTVVPTAGGPRATFTVPATASSSSYSIGYRVTDSAGQVASSTVTVAVCQVSNVTASPSPASVNADGSLQSPVTVTITTNGACGSLVVAFNSADRNGAPTQWVPFNSSNVASIPASTTAYQWDRPNRNQTLDVTLRIRQGFAGGDEATGTLATVRAA